MTDELAFVTDIDVRYRDLDAWNHVNNAVYATYLESARIDYLESVLPDRVGGSDFVLAHLDLDFVDAVEYGDAVTVAVRATDLGASSLSFAYEVRADDEPAATANTTQVYMGADGTPTPLPDDWREAVTGFEPVLD
jgi:acyl-CoA thioester hydrolase